MHLLIPVLAIWFVVLAGTTLLLYEHTCIQLVRQVPGKAPRTLPMSVPSLPGPSMYSSAAFPALAAPPTAAANLAPGTLVKGYLVQALLGVGGFARVYLAEQRRTGYRVALKVFEQRTAWQHERRVLASVTHLAFPRLLGAFHNGQGYFLALEYVPGVDLDHMLFERGVLPLREVLNLGVQLAESLVYLHSLPQPIIHRDLKPANVRLMADGQVRLLDLGIASVGARNPFLGWGTPEYLAPEELFKRPYLASDVYSLGVVLWEALTGKLPQPCFAEFPPLPLPEQDLPGLVSLLRQMMALKAAERPSAMTVHAALIWLRWLEEARPA